MFSQIICQNFFSSLGKGKKKKKSFLPPFPSPFCTELITVFSSERVGKKYTLKLNRSQNKAGVSYLPVVYAVGNFFFLRYGGLLLYLGHVRKGDPRAWEADLGLAVVDCLFTFVPVWGCVTWGKWAAALVSYCDLRCREKPKDRKNGWWVSGICLPSPLEPPTAAILTPWSLIQCSVPAKFENSSLESWDFLGWFQTLLLLFLVKNTTGSGIFWCECSTSNPVSGAEEKNNNNKWKRGRKIEVKCTYTHTETRVLFQHTRSKS